MELPSIEATAERMHNLWVEASKAGGYTTHIAEGVNMLVQYKELDESLKALYREQVSEVYIAIHHLRSRHE